MLRIFICCMSLTMFLSSHIAPSIQAQDATQSFRFIPAEAIAAVIAYPKRALEAPGTELYPREVISAAGIQQMGIDPMQVEQLVAFIEAPTNAGPPGFGIVLRMSVAQDPQKIFPPIMQGATPANVAGKPFFRAAHPNLPSVMLPNDRTIVIAPEPSLAKMVSGKPADSPLLKLLRAGPTDRQLTAVAVLDPVREMIRGGLAQAPPLPPPLERFKQLPDHVSSIEARVNVTGTVDTEVIFRSPNAASANQVQEMLTSGINLGKQAFLAQMANQMTSQDPVEQAAGRYAQRLAEHFSGLLQPKVAGQQVTVSVKGEANAATIGVLVALLLPAVQSAREAARRMETSNNLKQIGLAMHNHHDTFKRLPAQAIRDKDGKPLLSWRVAILPFVEAKPLFDQFKIDEPWDSEHNRRLIAQMPRAYQKAGRDSSDGKTTFLMPTGKGTLNENPAGVGFAGITDGTSNTIMCLEVNNDRAVIWTKPDDLEIDLQRPLDGLNNVRPGGFNALLCDGAVRFISLSIDPEVLRALFSPSGNEAVRIP